jgi:beta-lactam-binding protein with PASTA domain
MWLWILAAVLVAAAAAVLAVLLLSPKNRITVPNVVGQSEPAAAAVLRRAGLKPAPSREASATVPAGSVLRESPSSGSVVAKGTRVGIVVSDGPARKAVPGVEGLTAAQAIARLRSAGFKPASKTQASSTVASGHAIGTQPATGTEARVGSPVTVFVSSGPAPVHVPDVTGQPRTAAEAAITGAGLAVGNVTQQPSSTQSPGTVISQSPAAGSSLPAKGKVNLTVAKAPAQVSVPNVVGKSEALAAAALGSAGFTPKAATEPTTEEAKVGVVLKQSPAGGTKARKGAPVTITVGTPGTPTTTTPTTTTTTPTTPAPAPGPTAEKK